ncbi:MAG: zf-HC2 domain-containing protein [Thermoanaerobaculales bacterium]|jgi:anti-sigma factor (TIGR02949 family)|nr:zf-HC2 domain-containing protein [Thermoanaerobaculales bacterium]
MSRSDEPMTCDDVTRRIEAYTDGDLDESTVRDIRRHLDACADCAEQLDLARTLTAELRAMPKLDPPAGLLDDVRAAAGIPGSPRSVAGHNRRFRPWLAVAAAFAIAIAGALLAHHQHQRTAKAEALRAAAEVRLALACVGDITRRADRSARRQVISERLLPVISRSFGLTPRTQSRGAEPGAPGNTERSSS